jgi:hypothetical protein
MGSAAFLLALKDSSSFYLIHFIKHLEWNMCLQRVILNLSLVLKSSKQITQDLISNSFDNCSLYFIVTSFFLTSLILFLLSSSFAGGAILNYNAFYSANCYLLRYSNLRFLLITINPIVNIEQSEQMIIVSIRPKLTIFYKEFVVCS